MEIPKEFTKEKEFQKAVIICSKYIDSNPELFETMFEILRQENAKDPVREKTRMLNDLRQRSVRIFVPISFPQTIAAHNIKFNKHSL